MEKKRFSYLTKKAKENIKRTKEQKERKEGHTDSDFPELSKEQLKRRKKMLDLMKEKKEKKYGF